MPIAFDSATPDTFGVTGKLPLRSVAEAVEPAVFPYWITC